MILRSDSSSDVHKDAMISLMNAVCLQEKTLEAMDTEESMVHSNESDSEGLQVDRDLALTEKEKVR